MSPAMSNGAVISGSFLKVVSTVLLLLQSMGAAEATLRPMESLEWSFGAARMVALLRIDDIQTLYAGNVQCGIRYTATILGSENKQIQFGRFPGLKIESNYLAFLNYENDPEVVYRRIRDTNNLPDITDDAEKKKVISQVICNGIVPGLEVNFRFTWPIVVNYVIMTGLLPTNMPAEVRVYPTDSAQWWIQKRDLFLYLYALGRRR